VNEAHANEWSANRQKDCVAPQAALGVTFHEDALGATFHEDALGVTFHEDALGATFHEDALSVTFHEDALGDSEQVRVDERGRPLAFTVVV